MRGLRQARSLFGFAAAVLACSARAAEAPVVQTVDGVRVVTVAGTPEEIGRQYGAALADDIRRVLADLVDGGFAREPDAKTNILAGSRVMDRHQPERFRAEIRAMAAAAGVDYDTLMLAQYFGDVRRAIDGAGASTLCTSFALLPPLAPAGVLVGRNLDYFDHGVGDYASALVVYRPTGRHAFVTLTWTGLANGWSLLNDKGLFVSNNTLFGAEHHRLEAFSTCFMLRHLAENAATVNEALRLLAEAPRACGTGFLIAQADPPDAVWVEFDAEVMAVFPARDGFVGGANSAHAFDENDSVATPPPPGRPALPGVMYAEALDYENEGGRINTAWTWAREHAGRARAEDHFAAERGIPIRGMNLHSLTVDLTARRLVVSLGGIPACDIPPRTFRFADGALTRQTDAVPE